MSADRSQDPAYPPSIQQRRGSFSPGASLSELFARPGNSVAANAQPGQRRRMSITTLGLSGSPTQASQLAGRTARQGSLSSSVGSSSYLDEVAVMENENSPPASATSPFARRFSFGAQALRDKTGNGEAFNWSESLRTRAERAPSLGASSPPMNLDRSPAGGHHRSASIASMDFPARETPKQPRRKTPDFFQEKILRADFMD
ncbi:hypothetical protein DTO164E3_8618 [Paecilomyces variotii]|nr:hypothetical protein DTO032I3_9200 [Paecilomyces variotii]KAJ9191871.1 hypothetical protein DTO164E3_8618 [Paecilomyces variotii]KAJ9229471.1 hypothetical protein DTO169E5_8863 [Paecilomyces variotii]KAJ9271454.1 hypothetical protein DTO212C5_2534 [Paecilomyces variotii]KAJ9278681.1 hypothetical protein DTO021D3_4304 [Paecilomyces variotii]